MLPNKQRHAKWQKGTTISFLLPIFILFVSVITSLAIFTPAEAATSDTLNFQGRLLTNGGSLVDDGDYDIEFNLYSVDTGGSTLWTESRTGGNQVTIRNGYFSVYLGDVTAFPNTIPWDQELWLGMNVESDGEMTPRFKLTAVPYAFRAGAVLDGAGNALTGDDLAQLSPSSVQALNSAVAALRLNQTGSGALLQLQGDGSNALTVDKNGNAVLAGGVTLGDSTSTTAGTIRWQGTDLEVYNGADWVSLTAGGAGAVSSATATFFDATGGATIPSGSFTTINLDGTLSNSNPTVLSLAADEVTVTEDGYYEISYQVTSRLASGTRSGFNAKLQLDTGGGYSDVSGGQSYHYGRITTETQGTSAATVTLQLDAGDTLRLVGAGTSQSFTTISNATSMTVTRLGNDGGGGGTTAFQQGGNAFDATGVIGTTDTNGLDIVTDGNVALSIDALGAATFNNGLTVSGDSLDLNSEDLVNIGNISAADALTISSGGAGNLTLDSASDTLVLADNTIRRNGAGSTTIDLNDNSGATGLVVTNSDPGEVANLTVEGSITGLSFSGDGSVLTDLNGSAISSGTISDSVLSSNIARLDGVQNFSGTNTFDNNTTFSGGLTVGNSALTNAGNIRWTGADLEVYNGTDWVSLTSGGSVDPAGDYISVTTTANSNASTALYDVFQSGSYAAYSSTTNASNGIVYTPADGRFTIATDGVYKVDANYMLETSANALTNLLVQVNGASVYNHDTFVHTAVDPVERSVSVILDLTAGDYVEFFVDGSTGNITTHGGTSATIVPVSAASGGGGGGGGTAFEQGGNGFGAGAILGTTDTFGLNIITNGSNALTFTSAGLATFENDLTVDGGLTIDGDITAANGLTISSGTFADLTLSSASGDIILDADTLQRIGTGTTTLDLFDASGTTTFSIVNSDLSQVAGLLVEGDISGGDITSSGNVVASSFTGDGSGLTALNGTQITTGTIGDARLSANIARLDTAQGFSSLQSFNDGLRVGNTVSAVAGTIRWTGADFEGYDGSQWVSLTTPTSAPLLEGVLAFGKYDGVAGSALNEEGATVTKNATGDYRVTFDSAASTANYTIQLTVDEPVATLDDVIITADNISTAGFDVDVHEGDNGGTAGVRVDRSWNFFVVDSDAVVGGGGGGGSSGLEFLNGGNAFGGTAQLGTTDANGLRLFTNGNTVLDIDVAGDSVFTGALDVDGLFTANNGIALSAGSLDIGNNGIINAGAVAGVTTIDASGTATVGGLSTTGTVDATTVIVDFLTANNAITAPTSVNTINGLIINSGALSGVTGYTQTAGNFSISGTGTFSTGTGAVNLNGAVTTANSLDVGTVLNVAGTNGIVSSTAYFEGAITTGAAQLPGTSTGPYTFNADNDADEAAWTFVSPQGPGLQAAGGSNGFWVHDTDQTPSTDVGPVSGQGGNPDGYVYTEASTPGAFGDVFTMTNNSTFDATNGLSIDFYWNQRGDDNTAILTVQTNEAGAGWVTRGTYGGGDQPTGPTDVWNFESLDLGGGVVSDPSTQVRFVVTLPAAGTNWHNDFGIDTITITELGPFTYSDNVIEGYNASSTSNVDLLALRSDVGSVGNVVFRVDSDGDVFSDGTNNISNGADIAENYKNSDGAEPGDVVYFVDNRTVAKSSQQYQKGLAGVVSSDAAIILDAGVDGVPVGLKGRLPTKVSVANGLIEKGDYLTSGPDGRAVKATQTGTALGVAMEDASEDGLIDVFVGLTYYVSETNYSIPADGLEFPQQFTDIDVNSVATDGIIRLTREGELVNINGITLLAGGIDNNFSGIRSVGNVLGAYTVEAKQVALEAEAANDAVLQVTYAGNDTFTLSGDGSLGLRVTSEKAFNIADENGIDLFSVNTEGGVVQIGGGSSDPSAVLFILSRSNSPDDPIGVNGAQYYNEYMQKFRCYQDNEWVDCVTSVVSEYIIANNITQWAVESDESEMPGQPRTWLDLRSVSEYRIIASISTAGSTGTQCSMQYQLSGSEDWVTMDGSVDADNATSIKTDWNDVSSDITEAEEVQLRIVCSGGDGETELGISTLRLQVR